MSESYTALLAILLYSDQSTQDFMVFSSDYARLGLDLRRSFAKIRIAVIKESTMRLRSPCHLFGLCPESYPCYHRLIQACLKQSFPTLIDY
jgi:hypothetical protein